jgi:hypothetical protein
MPGFCENSGYFPKSTEYELAVLRRLHDEADDALKVVHQTQDLIESTREAIRRVDEQVPLRRPVARDQRRA